MDQALKQWAKSLTFRVIHTRPGEKYSGYVAVAYLLLTKIEVLIFQHFCPLWLEFYDNLKQLHENLILSTAASLAMIKLWKDYHACYSYISLHLEYRVLHINFPFLIIYI